MNEIKLCKDCKWCQPEKIGWPWSKPEYEFAACGHPEIMDGGGLVEGKSRKYCSVERESEFDIINKCGSEGKLWEPKP